MKFISRKHSCFPSLPFFLISLRKTVKLVFKTMMLWLHNYMFLQLLYNGVDTVLSNGRCKTYSTMQETEMQGCVWTSQDFRFYTELPEVQHLFNLTRVDGCIQVMGTGLVNLDFLHLDKNPSEVCSARNAMIVENPNLCLTPRIGKIMRESYKATIEDNLPLDCHKTCVAETFEAKYTRNVREEVVCYTLNGHFTMGKEDGTSKPDWHNGLKTVENVVNGSINFVNNKFTSLDVSRYFPKLAEIEAIHKDDPLLTIRNNQKLKDIVLPPVLNGKRVIVRGNPVLDQKTIDTLKESTSSDSQIQKAGECGFPMDITDDQQLGACTHIGSDLVLKDSTIIAVTNKIQNVAGCIVIENTNLDNLDFLELNSVETPKCVGVAESKIENNAKLCVTPRIERILKEVYNAKIQANGDCDQPCDQTRDMIRIQKEEMQCKKFSTGLKIAETSPPIDVSRLESVDGSIIVEGTTLESIEFPYLQQIQPKNDEPALIIENNLKLVKIELPATLPSFKVRVRGNKLLSQNSIDRLRKWSPASDIQQKGECGFVKEIQKASDLDGCERISSDLIMKSGNIDEITQNIIAVDGCISIVGTSLKSIDFLKLTDVSKAAPTCKSGGQSEVRQNSQLCIRPRVRKTLETSFGADLKANKHEDCASTCNGNSLAQDYQELKEEGVKCTILQGNLVISGLSKIPDWFNALKTVTEIQNGALIIENNTISEITVFPKLMTVENEQTSDQAVAIQIRNNANLVKLEFPVLEEVSIVSGDVRVLIENNPKFQMSLKMKERFDNLGEGVSYDKAGEPKREEPKKDKETKKSASTFMVPILWIGIMFILVQ